MDSILRGGTLLFGRFDQWNYIISLSLISIVIFASLFRHWLARDCEVVLHRSGHLKVAAFRWELRVVYQKSLWAELLE